MPGERPKEIAKRQKINKINKFKKIKLKKKTRANKPTGAHEDRMKCNGLLVKQR